MDSILKQQPADEGVSFDEIADFATPTQRQDYYEPKPEPETAQGDLPNDLVDPDGDAYTPIEGIGEGEQEHHVSPEKAQRTGERIARLADTAIDFTLSKFVARNDESYRADEKDLQDIAECWGEIATEHDWDIGPGFTLVFLYMMVYGPLVKQAVADRRMAEMEARQAELESRVRLMEQMQNQNAYANASQQAANTAGINLNQQG